MTLSNTTGFDLPLDKYSGVATLDKKVPARQAAADADADDNTRGDLAADEDAAAAVADIASDVAQTETPILAPRIPLPPVARPVVTRSRQEICDTLAKAAHSNALPVPFFIRLLFQESGFDSGVVSSAGAQGIAQFMPATAASEGLVNPFDPLQAIPASARLLRKLFEQFGNLGLAAAAYNAGPKRIQDWLAKKGKLPEETQGYVKIVTGRPAETWRVASASKTELTLPRRAPCKDAVPAPAHARIVAAASTHHATHAAAAKTDKPGVAAASHKKAPIQQLAARKHKNKHKNQKLAQK